MNREDIIRMAKNSGLFVELVLERDLDWLERFATLVASAEREANVEAINKLMMEFDKIPRTATTKLASTIICSVGKEFVDLIQARGKA